MKIPVLIRMPVELKEQLQRVAIAQGITLTGLVLNVLWNWMKKQEGEKYEK